MNSLVIIGSGCLVCAMPLALYLLFLGFLNQRSRPTLISGSWDFACALLGLSGFLLVGGPILLSIFDSTWRTYWFGGNFTRLQAVWDTHHVIWSTVAIIYYTLLLSSIGFFLWWRRRVTLIYNLDPTLLEEAIGNVCDTLGIGWKRVLGGFQIGVQGKKSVVLDDDAPATTNEPKTTLRLSGEKAFVQIDSFPSMRHASLRWRDYNPLLRREIEEQLTKQFLQTESPPNPAGGWFVTAAVSLFFVMLVWMGFLIYWFMRQPKTV